MSSESGPSASSTPDGLARSASSSAVVAGGGQAVRLVLQTTGIIVLARLLSPEDYGILAIAVAISGLGEMLRDFGLANASVQAAQLSRHQRDNLFWVNTLLGLLFGTAAFLVAPAVGDLFGDETVGHVLQVLAFGFLANGIATQPRASLVRSMRFVALNIIDTSALLISLAVAVWLAVAGAGAWALAFMLLSQSIATLAGVVIAAKWLPGPPRSGASIRPFLGFGAGLFGSQLLSYATKNVNTFIIGLSVGLVPLGYYNRASQLLNLPLAQLQAPATQVALPVLSRLADDERRFDRFLLRGQTILVHLTTVVLTSSAALATPLFALVLGQRWIEAAPVYQLLALSGLTMVVNYATYWVFMARGATASHLRLSLIVQPLTIAAVLAGAPFGVYGILVGYLVANTLSWPFTLWWLGRRTGAPVMTMFRNGLRAVAAYGMAGSAALGSTVALSDQYLLRVVLGIPVYLAVVAVLALVWRRFRQDLLDIARTRQFLRSARGGA